MHSHVAPPDFSERHAPHGFVWQRYGGAVFLKPLGWSARERRPANPLPVMIYAMSPENFSEDTPFETGFTVQIMRDCAKSLHIGATALAQAYLKPFKDARRAGEKIFLERRAIPTGELTFYRYLDAAPGQTRVIVHKFVVANDAADSVYAFTFESPAADWDFNWARFGTPIVSQIELELEIKVNASDSYQGPGSAS